MTLKERAREIVAGVTGVTVQEWKEGDEEFVRQQLEKLLGEAAGGICPECQLGSPRTLIANHYTIHKLDRKDVYCQASPIWRMVEGG